MDKEKKHVLVQGPGDDFDYAGITPDDPKRVLPPDARQRIANAHLKSDLIRRGLALETVQEPPDTHSAKLLESIRLVFKAVASEFARCGVRGKRLRQILEDEADGACNSLECHGPMRRLIQGEAMLASAEALQEFPLPIEALEPIPTPVEAATHLKRARGRPAKIAAELKEQARKVKANGGTNRDAAAMLYGVKYPTPQQVKNVCSLLRKRKPNRTS